VVLEAAAFTGDLLFVDSVGRPDLAGKTRAWSTDLFESLRRAKTLWPGAVRIYPAHYAGEEERRPDRTVWRPFGELLRTNDSLGIADPAVFRDRIASRVRTPPDAYRRIKAVNVNLLSVDDEEADLLEAGKNECALG
jgi:glyoxylase-like metal-dependent hydrolase (beta-lactamase superfamily II)